VPRNTRKDMALWPAPKQANDAACVAKVYNREFRLILSSKRGQAQPPDVIISLPKGDSGFSLTSLSADELRAVRALFDLAFELAEPISEILDDQALKAWEDGDDTFKRLYRAAPVFALRERVLTEHYSRLPDGPERVARLVADIRKRTDDLARARGSSSQVSDRTQRRLGTADHAPEDGDDPRVDEGPEAGGLPG
jgi:hypothetical protein